MRLVRTIGIIAIKTWEAFALPIITVMAIFFTAWVSWITGGLYPDSILRVEHPRHVSDEVIAATHLFWQIFLGFISILMTAGVALLLYVAWKRVIEPAWIEAGSKAKRSG